MPDTRGLWVISLCLLFAGCGGSGSGSSQIPTADPTPVAPIEYPRDVFVANTPVSGPATLSLFSVAFTGALVPRGDLVVGDAGTVQPTALAVGPQGVYVVDGHDATLTVVTRPWAHPYSGSGLPAIPVASQVLTGLVGSNPIAVAATGSHVLVLDAGTLALEEYAVASATGLLQRTGSATVGNGPVALVANGNEAYVLAGTQIEPYALASGTPTFQMVTTVPVGATGLSLNAAATRLYVLGGSGVQGYSIDPTSGALGLLAASASALTPAPTRLAWNPNGQVAYGLSAGNNALYTYAVAPSGAFSLTNTFQLASAPTALAVDGGGSMLTVTDGSGVRVFTLGIPAAPTPLNTWRTAGHAVAVGVTTGLVPVALAPTRLTTVGNTNLRTYAIDPQTGLVPAGVNAEPQVLETAPVTFTGGNTVDMNVATANCVPLIGGAIASSSAGGFVPYTVQGPLAVDAPTTLSNVFEPTGATLDPNGRYLFVPDGANPGVPFPVFDLSTASPTTAATLLSGTTIPNGYSQDTYNLAIDPTDHFAYLSNAVAHQLNVYQVAGGQLTLLSTLSYGNNPVFAPQVSPTGRWLYLGRTDATTGVVTTLVYAIDPTSGALSLLSGEPVVGFPTGGEVLVDPLGRWLLVITTSNTAGTSTTTARIWTVDPDTGALSAAASTVTLAPPADAAFRLDLSGHYLYGFTGAPVGTSTSFVNAWRIDSIGQITPDADSQGRSAWPVTGGGNAAAVMVSAACS